MWSAAFSPDGTCVVTASVDGSDLVNETTCDEANITRVWDAVSSKPISPPIQHQGSVHSAAFSPDGTRVVAIRRDNTARVWDLASGKPLSPSLKHQAPVSSAAFSPDGARVVTTSWDNTARVWDAASGKPLSPPLPHTRAPNSAAFSPDGTRVVTISDGYTAHVWSMPLHPGTLADWRAIAERAGAYTVFDRTQVIQTMTDDETTSHARSDPQ